MTTNVSNVNLARFIQISSVDPAHKFTSTALNAHPALHVHHVKAVISTDLTITTQRAYVQMVMT
jgi:hypothetical protein